MPSGKRETAGESGKGKRGLGQSGVVKMCCLLPCDTIMEGAGVYGNYFAAAYIVK